MPPVHADLKVLVTSCIEKLIIDPFRLIQRGAPFVIAGASGVGKSRAATALAVAGATRADWFGLSVHHQFKTMILQAENGPVRLRNEYHEITAAGLDDFIGALTISGITWIQTRA